MKAWKRTTVVLLIAGCAALTGCSSSDSPKEALLNALAKTNDAKTFTYTGSFTIDDIRLPETPGTATNQEALMKAALPVLLKGAVIQVRGVVQKEPRHAELTLDAKLGTGDVKLSLTVPMIVTADRLYMKMPDVPGLGIPQEAAGKFVVIDAKTEEQGGANALADGSIVRLSEDTLKALFDSLDEKTYFSGPKAADVKDVPEGYKADRFVRVTVGESQADEAMTAIAGKAIPQIIDLILKNEAYMKALSVTEAQLEAAKKELTADKLKQGTTIKALDVTGGIQDDYLTFESGHVLVDSTDAAKGMKLDAHFELTRDNLNETVKFDYEEPKDAVPLDSLQDWLAPDGAQ
ncbi:hypothetical protein I8J29_18485 [Paenibacillus sp. MWE-103]|uniref:Lipoprotein n=1 Tax=Paenibacillus artemisiicola TaxID=1172618 RepID=A0ABS3WDL0_9BACL|nr:hypothetical protein [Paenibacillus artemisiicola]MBO7746200.1 hypothetical protein [Paenibacillus artemisiicola]